MSLIGLYFLHNTSVLSFYIDVVWTLSISIPYLNTNIVSKPELFRMLLPLLRHVVPINVGNCRLTIPVVKWHCACYALFHTFNIGEFKSFEIIPPQWNTFSMNLRTSLKVMMLLFHLITNNLSDSEDIRRQLRYFYGRSNMLLCTVGACSYGVKLVLFMSYCGSLYT